MKYVKRPVVVEAVQWDGVNDPAFPSGPQPSVHMLSRQGPLRLWVGRGAAWCSVENGGWIVREPTDHAAFYPVSAEDFADTYAPAPAEPNPDYDHERAMGREPAPRSAP